MNFDEPVQGHLHWNENEYSDGKKSVWKVILILSAVTVIEVGTAMVYDHLNPNGGSGKLFINLFMVVASVVKVFYIMGTFMHLGHETKGFKMTVLLPFLFLIWAIIAFTYEGASWHAMRGLLNIF
jgi:caa(3)-type oxidase subunit IV